MYTYTISSIFSNILYYSYIYHISTGAQQAGEATVLVFTCDPGNTNFLEIGIEAEDSNGNPTVLPPNIPQTRRLTCNEYYDKSGIDKKNKANNSSFARGPLKEAHEGLSEFHNKTMNVNILLDHIRYYLTMHDLLWLYKAKSNKFARQNLWLYSLKNKTVDQFISSLKYKGFDYKFYHGHATWSKSRKGMRAVPTKVCICICLCIYLVSIP